MVEVKVYTTDWCPFCRRAEALLRAKGIAYERIDVDGDRATRRWLESATGQHTVPQIFIDGTSIGGCQELYALHASGGLDALVRRSSPA
jgi:glutaredoxin 3